MLKLVKKEGKTILYAQLDCVVNYFLVQEPSIKLISTLPNQEIKNDDDELITYYVVEGVDIDTKVEKYNKNLFNELSAVSITKE